MHNNYYFILKLSRELSTVFTNAVLSECYSQEKDELIFHFIHDSTSIFIKADLNPDISCLSFPTQQHRAHRNSVDLFKDIMGAKVKGINTFENERCFSLVFDDGHELLFKMFGKQANIILFKDRQFAGMFRNQLSNDESIELHSLHKTINWTKEAFIQNKNNLKQYYFTFGKPVWQWLHEQEFEKQDTDTQWQILLNLKADLENAAQFYLISDQRAARLSMLPASNAIKKFSSAIEALNTFYHELHYQHGADDLKHKALSKLEQKIKAANNYINKNALKANSLQTDTAYKTWADLLMANLHLIPKGAKEVHLNDLYQANKTVGIKLKPEQSAQKNAEVFYRKAKNQQIQIDKLQESISKKKTEIEQLNHLKSELQQISELKKIRQFIQQHKLAHTSQSEKIILPYHEVEFKNFKILIGKHAAANDELTLKYSYKEDLWLHAKDVAGSHVLIKHQAGKKFPKDVIERAAQLAAYHSKRKTESLCPVVYTAKKFVRKRKGAAAGEVVVEREQVIMVEPKPA